jgi:hypothetical protein
MDIYSIPEKQLISSMHLDEWLLKKMKVNSRLLETIL